MAAILEASQPASVSVSVTALCTAAGNAWDKLEKARREVIKESDGTYRDERDHVAHFLFDEFGHLVHKPPTVTEEDVVCVHHLVDLRQPDFYHADITGPTTVPFNRIASPPGSLKQLADSVVLAMDTLNKTVEKREFTPEEIALMDPNRWTVRKTYGGPFAGTVKISVITPNRPKAAGDGSNKTVTPLIVDVESRPLFRFAGRVGLVSAGVRDTKFASFKATSAATTSTIISSEDGAEIQPTLSVSLYLWEPQGRDVRRPATGLRRVNPILGLGLADPGNNYHAGLGFELRPGVDITAGVQWQRVSKLQGGLMPGGQIQGDQIPQKKDWDSGSFIGVSIDADVFTKVFNQFLQLGRSACPGSPVDFARGAVRVAR